MAVNSRKKYVSNSANTNKRRMDYAPQFLEQRRAIQKKYIKKYTPGGPDVRKAPTKNPSSNSKRRYRKIPTGKGRMT